MSFRTDTVRIDGHSRTPQGFLRVDGNLSRTGIFTYRNGDGTERKEYRPAASVFEPGSIASFESAPVTVGHPSSRLVGPHNAKDLSVGHVREVRKDASFLSGSLIVSDAETIRKIESGELAELSGGYQLEYDPTPGVTPEGERYDGVQHSVVGNHVALLPAGQARGGAGCRIRLDSKGDELLEDRSDGIGKISLMTPEQIAALQADLAAAKANADKATATATAEKTRADSLEGANRVLTAQLTAANDPAKFQASVDARVNLLSQARTDSVDVNPGMSERDVRLAIIAKRVPTFRADGLTDDAVAGAFAMIVAMPHPSLAQPVLSAAAARTDSEEDPLEKAHAAGLKAAHELHLKGSK